ncbi:MULTISPECIES: hypothetical protein [Micromonospora]|uniref:hypothetical protein n=1 Tax=Micromonospora TaxID=1873 RepID=UPI001315673D|nr:MULTISPECIES: hypothetical protein [Micromonospora]
MLAGQVSNEAPVLGGASWSTAVLPGASSYLEQRHAAECLLRPLDHDENGSVIMFICALLLVEKSKRVEAIKAMAELVKALRPGKKNQLP